MDFLKTCDTTKRYSIRIREIKTEDELKRKKKPHAKTSGGMNVRGGGREQNSVGPGGDDNKQFF